VDVLAGTPLAAVRRRRAILGAARLARHPVSISVSVMAFRRCGPGLMLGEQCAEVGRRLHRG
jgi:S-methylmethionine-dependent homocysteine/selenocysteine methylase